MSVTEIKQAISELSPEELAELSAFVAERDAELWNQQIDEDFDERGRLHGLLQKVILDIRSGHLDQLP